MSRILIVEPRDILRQAILLALFPEHEVQSVPQLVDDNEALTKDCDLLIVGASALSGAASSCHPVLRKLQERKIPMIWIDDPGDSQTLPHGKIVVLKSPIQKDTLESAVAKCLDGSPANHNRTASMPAKGQTTTRETKTAAASHTAGPQIIELVDVVAEPPERGKGKTQERRTQ
jgi:DNA-binding NtrC family response regulator